MDDLAIPICKDVNSVKAKGRRFAGPKYVACYLALAALLLVCTWVLYQRESHQSLIRISKRSVADEKPRLIIHPLLQNDTDSTLLWYRTNDPTSYKVWVDELDRLKKVYSRPGLTPGRGQSIINCGYDDPPRKGMVCDVDVRDWGPCAENNDNNYHRSEPCVLLELNQIPGWVPDYYSSTSDLPATMPVHLKDHISTVAQQHSKYLNSIWISCEGKHSADIEHIGPINYYPKEGFPGYFYPYENTAGYLSPIVAVHFKRPKTGVLINIECKAWAKNINHDQHEGSARFELMID